MLEGEKNVFQEEKSVPANEADLLLMYQLPIEHITEKEKKDRAWTVRPMQ